MNAFKIDSQATINHKAVQRIRSGHLWIYASDVEREPASGNPPIVRVVDAANNVMGYAFYSRQSQIRLRLLSRDPEPPTPEFFRMRIKNSIARRKTAFGSASACRLIFGEGDLLPGIIVDRYQDYLVAQTLSSGADGIKSLLIDILKEELNPAAIIERNDVKTRRLEGLEEIRSVIFGAVPEEIEITEGGNRFIVDLQKGQKTGFFLDQSQNRMAARSHASGAALDCFANTGAFAIQMAGKCDSVLGVDISPESIAMARRNSELNQLANVEFIEANVFDFLRKLEDDGRRFDVINLDPPAFAKNRKALQGARSGYKEINLRAMKLLKPEGTLITSSCSYHMLESDFYDVICEAARDCRRYIQVIEKRGQAEDHPILAGMPETCYLKCFILRAL